MKIDGSVKSMNTSSFTSTANKKEVFMQPIEQLKVKQTEQHHEKHNNINSKNEEKNKNDLSKEDAKHIVKGMNEFLQPQYTSVSFKLHEELDRYYVEVIDKQTKEVIREIPDKEILDMYAKMTEYLGLFIDRKL